MKVKELEAFKAVYCGLCRTLGERFGAASRFTLSYDFTFAACVAAGVRGETLSPELHRCAFNPFVKRIMCTGGSSLDFAADCAVIMLHYKLIDNIQDNCGVKKPLWSALKPLTGKAYAKAASNLPKADEIIRAYIESQNALEAANENIPDKAAEPTALAMAGLFGMITEDEFIKRPLERMGYFIGKFCYIADALDDLEKDIQSGNYNVYALKYNITTQNKDSTKTAYESASDNLKMTAAECQKAANLIDFGGYTSIITNIITDGLNSSIVQVIQKKEERGS
jgi:hypothetical protein